MTLVRWVALGGSAVAMLVGGGCYRAHERAEGSDAAVVDAARGPASSSCTVPSVTGCTRWNPAGPPTLLSDPEVSREHVSLGAATVRDCGVLVGWSVTVSHGERTTVSYATRTIDWSGTPTAPAVPHPVLTDPERGDSPMHFARGPSGIGAIVAGLRNCVFLPLDDEGRERGPLVSISELQNCEAPVAVSSGYSFIGAPSADASTIALVTLDAMGHERRRTRLGPLRRHFIGRTALDDGTFLLHSFEEDPRTGMYTVWLQPFSDVGSEVASAVTLGEEGVPVLTIPAGRGLLSAWMTARPGGLPLRVRASDRQGRPRGEARDMQAEGALYGHALAGTTGGDAVLAWVESHAREMPEWRLRTVALAPDGAARAEPVTVLTGALTRALTLVVDPSGARALALFSAPDMGDGVRALPLVCER